MLNSLGLSPGPPLMLGQRRGSGRSQGASQRDVRLSATSRHRFVRVTGGKTTKEKVRSSTARCTLPASRLQWWRSPRCGSLQTNSGSADLMRMVLSSNDEFVSTRPIPEPTAAACMPIGGYWYVSIPPRQSTFHRQFDKTNTYG